jgi:hypothetical protein
MILKDSKRLLFLSFILFYQNSYDHYLINAFLFDPFDNEQTGATIVLQLTLTLNLPSWLAGL